VARESVSLVAIWATHHHPDHVGGNKELIAAVPELEVIASERDGARIAGVTRTVGDGDEVHLDEIRARIIENPGHTLGAISFWIADHDAADRDAVFTGDTLFAAGCGRLFEGDAPMMHASLQRLAALPPSTRVYFGHEYTEANLRFAAHVEPDHAPIATRITEVASLRARGVPTTPSTIADELATNPFIRSPDAATFAARRAAKDTFK
jgi:hydroxyacylglutathione hydrolase